MTVSLDVNTCAWPDCSRSAEWECPRERRMTWCDEHNAEHRRHGHERDIQRGFDGERCRSCGTPYEYVWHAPDDLWAKVAGRTDGGGLRCIPCFDREARAALGTYLNWTPAPENTPQEERR